MASKTSQTYKNIKPLVNKIFEGKMLCIDPSTGSKSSLPGYAWYENGVLKESGEIWVDISLNRSKKLYEISRTIREDFEKPDILVVEYIPPVTYRGRSTAMNNKSIIALQKAIGAIIASHPVDHLLEIPASAWRAHKPDDYEKTDIWDAICLGLCVVNTANQILQESK